MFTNRPELLTLIYRFDEQVRKKLVGKCRTSPSKLEHLFLLYVHVFIFEFR